MGRAPAPTGSTPSPTMSTQRRTILVPLAVGALAAAMSARPTARQESVGMGVALAERCAMCHDESVSAEAMRDASGATVAPHTLWSGSVHSASSVDPIWRATLAGELAAFPERSDEIAQACLRCHAPMASVLGLAEHGSGDLLHALSCEGELGRAARDGVSCTICHGIAAEGLGTPASFDGGFRLDDQRRLFGPHRDPIGMPMLRHTGFTPTFGEHIGDSALCATCHTLETDVMDGDGAPSGAHFLEQSPYLEWQDSAFGRGEEPVSCQSCHLPVAGTDGRPIETRLAHNPAGRDFPFLEPRAPVGRHVFTGGNTLLLSMLAEAPDALGAPGSAADYARGLEQTREQLATRTARLELVDLVTAEGRLEAAFEVRNLTGHKLPTGYPARRMFLTVEVFDAEGQVLFASGRTDAEGRLVDGRGRVLPSESAGGPASTHLDRIVRDDQVAQWRAEAVDADGAPAFRLLAMARYAVDDRLLPLGWSADAPNAERTAPRGVEGDPDFNAGSDLVKLRVQLPDGRPAARVVARLRYQPYSARWLDELGADPTPELERLQELLAAGGLAVEELDRVEWSAP
jgi:hypothetical protein